MLKASAKKPLLPSHPQRGTYLAVKFGPGQMRHEARPEPLAHQVKLLLLRGKGEIQELFGPQPPGLVQTGQVKFLSRKGDLAGGVGRILFFNGQKR